MSLVTRVDLVVLYEDGTRTVRQGETAAELRAVADAMDAESNRRPMIFTQSESGRGWLAPRCPICSRPIQNRWCNVCGTVFGQAGRGPLDVVEVLGGIGCAILIALVMWWAL